MLSLLGVQEIRLDRDTVHLPQELELCRNGNYRARRNHSPFTDSIYELHQPAINSYKQKSSSTLGGEVSRSDGGEQSLIPPRP